MANYVRPISLSSIAGTALTTSYKAMNAGGLTQPCILVRLVNNTSKNLTISYDGISDHDFLIAGETLPLSFQSTAKGTVVYVKSDAAGTGTAYLSGYYQER